jgi:hypothetical protein
VLFMTMRPASPASCESPRFSGFLDLLSRSAGVRPGTGRQVVWPVEGRPHAPSLHLRKVGRFWSVRIGLHHRAVSVDAPDGLLWFWIGTHAEYDKLVG